MTSRERPAPLGSAQATRIEIDIFGRWNACALLQCLASYQPFLVQHGPEQWVAHAQTPGCHGETAESAIAAIAECLDERGVEETSIRIDGKPYPSPAIAGSLS